VGCLWTNSQRHHEKTASCFEPTIDYVVVKTSQVGILKVSRRGQHSRDANRIRRRSHAIGRLSRSASDVIPHASLALRGGPVGNADSLLRRKLATPRPTASICADRHVSRSAGARHLRVDEDRPWFIQPRRIDAMNRPRGAVTVRPLRKNCCAR